MMLDTVNHANAEPIAPRQDTARDRLPYLDGIRGWAAVLVVVYHSSWEMFKFYLPPGPDSLPRMLVGSKWSFLYLFFTLSALVLSRP